MNATHRSRYEQNIRHAQKYRLTVDKLINTLITLQQEIYTHGDSQLLAPTAEIITKVGYLSQIVDAMKTNAELELKIKEKGPNDDE